MNAKTTKQPETDFPRTIGNPARRALELAGFTKLKQLTKVMQAELSKLHGVGPKSLRIIKQTLESKGMSFASASSTDVFMENLDTLRKIIKRTNKEITEQIKWNAPSYAYRGEYLVTFNLRETKRVHLVFHNPMVPKVKSHLLEGDYVDRRMTYFSNMKDIKVNEAELEKVLKQLVKLNAK